MSTRLSLVVALATVLLPLPLRAGEIFDYTFDRFEVDGNVNGPFDGTPDLVDDFDDGVPAPWYVRRGTISESGGLLHVQSPGLYVAFLGITPVPFDASAAGVDGVLQVGAGDATLRVVLPMQAIGANDAVSFDLSTIATTESPALYYGGIVLTNFNTDMASAFTPPYPIGLAVTSHLDRISYPTNSSLLHDHHVVDPTSVTGPIVLELRYDDASHEATPALSVDGGATFVTLAPFEVESDSGAVTVQTAVAAYAGTCPADAGLSLAKFNQLSGVPGRQSMKLTFGFPSPSFFFARGKFRIIVSDRGAGDATLFDVTVPDGATAFQHPCGTDDGYFGHTYKNKSNAIPPACVPGSAQGLRKVQMSWNGTLRLKVDVAHTTLPVVTGPVRATVYAGDGPVNECDGWVSELPCQALGKGVRCR